MGKHTQGKYYIVSDDDLLDEGQQGKIIIQSEKGYTIAECPFVEEYSEEMQANAAFIVKACNNHDALVEALKYVLDQAGLSNDSPSYIKIQTALAQVEKG